VGGKFKDPIHYAVSALRAALATPSFSTTNLC